LILILKGTNESIIIFHHVLPIILQEHMICVTYYCKWAYLLNNIVAYFLWWYFFFHRENYTWNSHADKITCLFFKKIVFSTLLFSILTIVLVHVILLLLFFSFSYLILCYHYTHIHYFAQWFVSMRSFLTLTFILYESQAFKIEILLVCIKLVLSFYIVIVYKL